MFRLFWRFANRPRPALALGARAGLVKESRFPAISSSTPVTAISAVISSSTVNFPPISGLRSSSTTVTAISGVISSSTVKFPAISGLRSSSSSSKQSLSEHEVLEHLKKYGLSAEQAHIIVKALRRRKICLDGVVDMIDAIAEALGLKDPKHGPELFTLFRDFTSVLGREEARTREKLKWMKQIGLSPTQACGLLHKMPGVLPRSIESLDLIYKKLVVLYNQTEEEEAKEKNRKANVDQEESENKARDLISTTPRILTAGWKVVESVHVLESSKMPSKNILRLMKQKPMSFATPMRLQQAIEYAVGFGLETHTANTFNVVKSFVSLSDDSRKDREAVYHAWGWTGPWFQKAISNHGAMLALGEENINASMSFLVHECAIDLNIIVTNGRVLDKSIDKTLVPRLRLCRFLWPDSPTGNQLFNLFRFSELQFEERMEEAFNVMTERNKAFVISLLVEHMGKELIEEEEHIGKELFEEEILNPLVKLYRLLKKGFDKDQILFPSSSSD